MKNLTALGLISVILFIPFLNLKGMISKDLTPDEFENRYGNNYPTSECYNSINRQIGVIGGGILMYGGKNVPHWSGKLAWAIGYLISKYPPDWHCICVTESEEIYTTGEDATRVVTRIEFLCCSFEFLARNCDYPGTQCCQNPEFCEGYVFMILSGLEIPPGDCR